MAESSPFPFQGPLDPGTFSGRDELRRDLARRLTEHRLTALLGPRRYGKTSLLRQVTADLEEVGPQTVWVDLYEMGSMADVASAVDQGMAGTRGSLRVALDRLAGSMSFKLGVLGFELAKGPRDRPDPSLLLRTLLQVLVRTAEKQPLVLVLDEFSGLDGVEHAAGVFRTQLQHHYRELGIVFAGSQPSTMSMMFTDQAQPFFAQADLIELGPLTDAEVIDAVHRGFEVTGRGVGPLAGRIAGLAEGHPQRAMQLADAVWQQLDPGGQADDSHWIDALEAVRASVDSGSERLFALLPTGHQKVLRVVAGGGSVYGTAGGSMSLSPGTARSAVSALVGNGYLVRRDQDLVVVDPLLADWISRRFPL